MEALTPGHLVIILIAFVLLVGYKKLPEATRSLGRSLRIFRSEMRAADEPGADAPSAPAGPAPLTAAPSPEELEAEAASAERHAAELRARVGCAGSGSPTRS